MIDPVCLFHGLRRSQHLCLVCCLCFRDLLPGACSVIEEGPDAGKRIDICVSCIKHEKTAIRKS